MTRGYKF